MAFVRASCAVVLFLVGGCGTSSVVGDAGSDASASNDSGGDVGSTRDAGLDAAPAANDANVDGGAPSCDESRVTFVPPGGHIAIGQLCDDVFVCPADAAAAATIAALGLTCSATTEGPCTTATTCVLRPSTLDAAEVQQICAVTTLGAPPPITCIVYL